VQSYALLFESLLRDPLTDLHFIGPEVIVIDALDESEDAFSRRRDMFAFHRFLAKRLPELPANFRILVTSRPEVDILDAFTESPLVRRLHMDDPQLSDGVDDDIRTYVRAKLSKAKIAEADMEMLVKKAEGLFQWASVACDYIGYPPAGLSSVYCLRSMLSSPQTSEDAERLDDLYSTVLEAHFNMKHSQVRHNFQSVMRQVLGTISPLSITSLNIMCHHAAGGNATNNFTDVSDVVKHMSALLSNVVSSNLTLPIAPLHTSFRDFLTDPNRSGKFYVNMDKAHDQLAHATLRTMQEMLRFNICELETSYHLNTEVPDLNDRIERCIPSALWYSCRFWAEHLAHISEFNIDLLKC